MSNDSKYTSSETYIGYIEAMVSNTSNPFEKQRIYQEMSQEINLRHLHESEAKKVTKHIKIRLEKSTLERQAYLAVQLNILPVAIRGALRPAS